jgi:hypothetical protein
MWPNVEGAEHGCHLVANNEQKGAKTTPFCKRNPTEVPCFVSTLRVTAKTAKPLCAGSIPARASNSPKSN